MGGTKSKVDDTPDEESDESTQTSESTYRNTEYTRHRHDQRQKRRSPTRKKRQSNNSTPTPDEILDKPFTYRSRKEQLLESLNVGAGDYNDVTTDEYDSYEKTRDGKISVQKIVENIHANLNVKSGSPSSVKDDHARVSKKLNISIDSLTNIEKKSHRRKSSSKVVSSSKEVKPTGVEEKIIESLIQPRKRQHSLPRSVKLKNSSQSVNVLSNPVAVTFDSEVSKSVAPKPPELPPIDFPESSASDKDNHKANKRISTLTASILGKDVRTFDSLLSKDVPFHLKELKLRFSNDVPRSPHEDNLNSTPTIEKSPPIKQTEKPLDRQDSAPGKSYFTNNVPVADSLHILGDKTGAPKVVIRGAKDQEKRSNEHRKHRTSQGAESNQDLRQIQDNASDVSKRTKAVQGHHCRPVSAGPKSILKSNQDDDIIKCFPVKAEYNESIKDLAEEKIVTRGKSKNSNAIGCKTARTQTSCLGLVDSAVQTLPDLELQGQRIRDDIGYEAAIDNKAKKVLRRVSMDRSVDRKTKEKRGKRYRNGSTQWEEVDLLDISSCSMLNRKGPDEQKERPRRSKSRPRAKVKENKSNCNEPIDCQEDRNEVCCMHLQVVPSPPTDKRSTRRESRLSKHSDLLGKQEPKDTLRQENKRYEGCSGSGLSSSEKLSAWATYSTSSARSRELSLLSPFRSSSTVRSKNKPEASQGKNEDVYRQMEELGLGFLRDGEWVAYNGRSNLNEHHPRSAESSSNVIFSLKRKHP